MIANQQFQHKELAEHIKKTFHLKEITSLHFTASGPTYGSVPSIFIDNKEIPIFYKVVVVKATNHLEEYIEFSLLENNNKGVVEVLPYYDVLFYDNESNSMKGYAIEHAFVPESNSLRIPASEQPFYKQALKVIHNEFTDKVVQNIFAKYEKEIKALHISEFEITPQLIDVAFKYGDESIVISLLDFENNLANHVQGQPFIFSFLIEETNVNTIIDSIVPFSSYSAKRDFNNIYCSPLETTIQQKSIFILSNKII